MIPFALISKRDLKPKRKFTGVFRRKSHDNGSVHGSRLMLVDRKPTEGAEPNAVAQYRDLLYVLNVGGSNVVGFTLNAHGELRQIPNSIRFLTTNNSETASLAFSPDGPFLLVTERATNNIDVFLRSRRKGGLFHQYSASGSMAPESRRSTRRQLPSIQGPTIALMLPPGGYNGRGRADQASH